MSKLFESLIKIIQSISISISNILHNEIFNSFNKTEYHFHGPVNFMGSKPKELKSKINSSPSPKIDHKRNGDKE